MIPHLVKDGALFLGPDRTIRVDLPSPVHIVLEDAGLLLLCLRPTSFPAFNVVAVDASGRLVWRIKQPTDGGSFIGIDPVRPGLISAYHSSGGLFQIDSRTGRVLSSQFVR